MNDNDRYLSIMDIMWSDSVSTSQEWETRALLCDHNGRLLFTGSRCAQILNLPDQPVTITDIDLDMSRFKWSQFTSKIIENQGKGNHVLSFLKKDNSFGQINCLVRYHHDFDMDFFSILLPEASQVNIIEELLDEDEDSTIDYVRATLNNIKQMVIWVDINQDIRYVNTTTSKVLGYTRKELLHMKLLDCVKKDNQISWNQIWQTLKTKSTSEFLSTFIDREGATIPVKVQTQYVSVDGEDFIVALITNRSNIIRNERILALSRKTLEIKTDAALWVNDKGDVVFMNNKTEELLGPENNLMGTSVFRHFLEFDKSAFEKYKKELKSEELVEFRLIMNDKENKKHDSHCQMISMEHEGDHYYALILKWKHRRESKEVELREALAELESLKGKIEEENIHLKEMGTTTFKFEDIITSSKEYKKVLSQIAQVADTDTTVLITGETGTGKELLARACHRLSDRADRQLVTVNCAALPHELIESELFGHEKGAFTGAENRKRGKFELADKATIFLDEIGELPLPAQAKLLRVLQEGEVQRIGSETTLKVDVRIIAATNRDLDEMVKKQQFRQDLLYRINVFPIHNIPLRERAEDIEPLTFYFTKKYSDKIGKEITKIHSEGLQKLQSYHFPGNVRELENIVERAVVLSQKDSLDLSSIFGLKEEEGNIESEIPTFEQAQKQLILDALEHTKWRVSGSLGAAQLLDLNPKTLVSKMRKLGIKR